MEQRNKAAIISPISSPPCLDSLTPRDKQWQGPAAQLCWGTLKRTLKRTGRSIKHIGDTLAVDKHQHNSMRRWLPRRWGKTEYSASGDKEREGSGIVGHWQLKSLCETHNTLSYFVSQTLYTLSIHSVTREDLPTSNLHTGSLQRKVYANENRGSQQRTEAYVQFKLVYSYTKCSVSVFTPVR